MVWIDDRWGMNTKEAIKAFNKMAECSHAYGYSTLATGNYSHAEGYSSLSSRQPTVVLSRSSVRLSTIVKMSIIREPLLKFNETNSVAFGTKIDWDVLEKNFGSNWAFDRGLY